jgi:uncharacterized protein DUF2877
LIGLGVEEVLRTPGRGRVAAVYARAAYIQLPGGLFALTTPEVPLGPLHAQVPFPLEAEQGSPVVAKGRSLEIGGRTLPLAGPVWRGALPDPDALAAAALLAVEVLEAASPSALREEPWRAMLDRATACLAKGDLHGAAAALGGVGPGLTPAGDDTLAGVLIATRARLGPAAEDELVKVAGAVTTSDPAAGFMRWAARGQSIAPVHDLFLALAAGDLRAAEVARNELCAFGHSSGADLALGLRLGLATQWP